MKIIGFAFVILLYAYACYLGVRGYFLVAARLRRKALGSVTRNALTYAWFLVFIALVVPFAIFFPLWVNTEWMVFADDEDSRMLLLLLGAACLALTAWTGWRRSRTSADSLVY
ncbi:hypothetical protein GCM10011487_05950 [Steroidobacter agaridevorans]|uniref:Uncharacterized protein n=1 Tax=Steroidobacter agaridevorans TaxID=2695856 RepID=A0A829Y6K6_9GAMM|nr:hypothetical protein [Steroidobacter agaridevorans]GFE78595.1 hypothetical protein GCM10011487_05950 [Steroidobacter agaridevorans]